MTTPQSGRTPSKRNLILLVLVGGVAVAGAAAWGGYMTGSFRRSAGRPRVAIVCWNQNPYWDPVEAGATDTANQIGATLTFVRSEPTVAAESQHIRDLVASGVQAIAIAPTDPKAEQAVIDEAAAKAVVITFDSDAPDTNRRGYIGTDDYVAGQAAGDEVRAAVPGGGQVIVSVGSLQMSNGRDRRQGLIDNLLDRGFHRDANHDPVDQDAKGKVYDVVATVLDDGDPKVAARKVAEAVAAHPNVKCVVGLFGYSGPAVVDGIAMAKPAGTVKVIGFDESAQEQALVQSGAISASILQAQYRCGQSLVRAMDDLLQGVAVKAPTGPQLAVLPVLVMRADNIDELRKEHRIRQVDVAAATPAMAPTTK